MASSRPDDTDKRETGDDAGTDRDARERGAYYGALVWLALLMVGLAVAGGLVYAVYRSFSRFFAHYDES